MTLIYDGSEETNFQTESIGCVLYSYHKSKDENEERRGRTAKSGKEKLFSASLAKGEKVRLCFSFIKAGRVAGKARLMTKVYTGSAVSCFRA